MVFFASLVFYVLYCGIVNKITLNTWIAILFVLFEGLILLVFKLFCPLTLMARKYSIFVKDNFDIYLPNILARYNKQIFTTIFVIGLLLVIYRIIN